MTGAAVGAESAAVEVVVGVAAETIARSARPAAIGVAALARDLRVAPFQGETDHGVIKRPVRPGRGPMAEAALLAEAPLMLILIGVTPEARLRDPHPLPVLVAIETFQFGMAFFECKSRQPVVEGGVLPCLGVVAGAAVVTKEVGMGVVQAMAVDTAEGGRLEGRERVSAEVAARALDPVVGPEEWEGGGVVVPVRPIGILAVVALEAPWTEGEHVFAGGGKIQREMALGAGAHLKGSQGFGVAIPAADG